eukprot:gene14932-7205_t
MAPRFLALGPTLPGQNKTGLDDDDDSDSTNADTSESEIAERVRQKDKREQASGRRREKKSAAYMAKREAARARKEAPRHRDASASLEATLAARDGHVEQTRGMPARQRELLAAERKRIRELTGAAAEGEAKR